MSRGTRQRPHKFAGTESQALSIEIADSQGEVENHAGGGTSKTPSGLISSVFAEGADGADKDGDWDGDEDQGHDDRPRKRRARAFASTGVSDEAYT